MIRKYADSDIDAVMKIWLITNIQAHSFISPDSVVCQHCKIRLTVERKRRKTARGDFHDPIGVFRQKGGL